MMVGVARRDEMRCAVEGMTLLSDILISNLDIKINGMITAFSEDTNPGGKANFFG